MTDKELTPKQRMFIAEYLVDMNATKAAERAGYSVRTAQEQGSRLLSNVMVAAEIQRRIGKREKKLGITQDYVLGTIQDTVERCRQAEEVRDREGNPTGEYQFEANAVLKGCELLGKHLKLFTEKREVKFDLDNISDEQLAELESKLAATESGPAGTGTP